MVGVCLLNDGKASFSVKYSGGAYMHLCDLNEIPSARFFFFCDSKKNPAFHQWTEIMTNVEVD